LGQIIAFGMEGTGSYGAALASFVRRNGHRVIEVNRPDRRMRRLVGNSDTLYPENAARTVLAGCATAEPKTADTTVEMIWQLKAAHDTAVKGRSASARAQDNGRHSIRHTFRMLAHRWQHLDTEAKELAAMIGDLVAQTAPQLTEPFGIGADTVAGDNPEGITSEATFAKLAGISPVPTGSGMTSGKHRITHGGH
jgi:transposase